MIKDGNQKWLFGLDSALYKLEKKELKDLYYRQILGGDRPYVYDLVSLKYTEKGNLAEWNNQKRSSRAWNVYGWLGGE